MSIHSLLSWNPTASTKKNRLEEMTGLGAALMLSFIRQIYPTENWTEQNSESVIWRPNLMSGQDCWLYFLILPLRKHYISISIHQLSWWLPVYHQPPMCIKKNYQHINLDISNIDINLIRWELVMVYIMRILLKLMLSGSSLERGGDWLTWSSHCDWSGNH